MRPDPRYSPLMIRTPAHPRTLLAATLGGLLLAAATGAAFAGWSNHGLDIFLSMAASGLAWCL